LNVEIKSLLDVRSERPLITQITAPLWN